ncbi:MAG TPA: hypothetical protein VGO43_08760 [Pyrinomonadaceae bacterium]|jgi:hypothetical protein|nr:hypothetical protein [Pyrinomonadaceae bacterium]
MKNRLGANAKQEMIDAAKNCRTKAEMASLAKQYAEAFNTTTATFYRKTRSVRPSQKTRSDKGKRVVDITSDATMKLMLGWMLNHEGMTAVMAYNTAIARGLNIPVTVETFERYLREKGQTAKTRRKNITPHRRFEASAPGEMFQFDISGLKERFYDLTTRKIIRVPATEVSKNHENDKRSRVKVWRFALIDDFSRLCFVRYYGVAKPSSSHVVDFLLQAYEAMGVCLRLYTDNDAVIKFGRNKRATEILAKVLGDQGGYENIFHLPGNSRATGKVERLHQRVERLETAVGQYLEERGSVTLEVLNGDLAPRIQHHINTHIHSETGQRPVDRWESAFSVIRRVNYQDLKAAFHADEHTVKLRGDLTFRLNTITYQLPTDAVYPFASWIGQKITIVFHDDLPYYTVLGLDGNEYDVVKDTARMDVAGEFQSTASSAEQLRKEAKALAKEDAKRQRQSAAPASIPMFDMEIPAEVQTNVSRFPKPETSITADQVREVAPGRVATPYAGTAIDFWQAYELLLSEFDGADECKAFLETIYTARDGSDRHLESELRDAMTNTDSRRLRAIS